MLPTAARQTEWFKAIVPLTRLVRSAIAAVVLLASISTLAMARQGDLTADRVLGQFDFTHNGTNILTNAGLSTPAAVAVDRSVVPNRLYVADMGNNRVLGWHSVDALKNGATADLVIGQQDFLSSIAQCRNAAVNGATLCSPSAIAVDGAGNLYVVDQGNNRVLEYNNPFTTDTLPDLVFGQNGSFTSSGCNLGGSITDATLCNPTGVAVDTAGNVYISDWDNSRILEYDSPLVTDTHADMVFGQGGKFNSGVCNNGGVAPPPSVQSRSVGGRCGRQPLYASDSFNWRVLDYNDPLAGNTTADWCSAKVTALPRTPTTAEQHPAAATYAPPMESRWTAGKIFTSLTPTLKGSWNSTSRSAPGIRARIWQSARPIYFSRLQRRAGSRHPVWTDGSGARRRE